MVGMKVAVIIPAAGRSERFRSSTSASPLDRALGGADDADAGRSKIEADLAGRPVFQRSIELFLSRPELTQILLAVPPDAFDAFEFRHGDKLAFLEVTLVRGGTIERWETVARALESIDPAATHVAVHDAARPLASEALIDRVFRAAAAGHEAVIPGVPVSGTLKRLSAAIDEPPAQEQNAGTSHAADDPLAAIFGESDDAEAKHEPADSNRPAADAEAGDAPPHVVQTLDRRHVVEVQTPQVFQRSVLERAYGQIDSMTDEQRRQITDDAGLIERLGRTVCVVPGEATNLKLTRPADLALLRAIRQLQRPRGESDHDLTARPVRGSRRFDDDED